MTELNLKVQFPEVFQLQLEVGAGQRIESAKLIHGFSYRPLERIIASGEKDVHETVYIVERICGLCSHSHTTAFCQAVENAFGLTPPPPAAVLRSVTAELERASDHLLNLAEVSHLLGLEDVFKSVFGLRREIGRVVKGLLGRTVHFGLNRIGGVNLVPSPELREQAATSLDRLALSARELVEAYSGPVRPELTGLGIVKDDPDRVRSTGPHVRALGRPRDIRADSPYAAYGFLCFKPVTARGGDAWARTEVRLGEVVQSLGLAGRLLESFPEGEALDRPERAELQTDESVSLVEAPRGEDRHVVGLTPEGLVRKLSVTVPTFRLIPLLEQALVGHDPDHVNLITASFDLCLACRDSM